MCSVVRMPIGYLISVILIAWCTLIALAPPRPRQTSPSHWTFWFGYLISEQPFVPLFWLLFSTVLAYLQGDIASPAAWAAVGLAALTVIGLGVIAWRGLRAGPVVEHALHEGLGSDWREIVGPEHAVKSRRSLPYSRIVFAPFVTRHFGVEQLANVRYGDAGEHNLLDVYRHRSRPSGAPTLLYFHGGAFRSGSKSREAGALLDWLASQGWVCISANYRLSPDASFPDHHVDAKKAIAWVRTHGHEYGADPSTLLVAGSSAGAHLAAIAALTPNDPRFQPGFEEVDTSVTAAVCLYGYYGGLDTDAAMPSSPSAYVRADAPPFFVAHGTLDTIVLVEDARAFVERLRSTSSAPVVYAELPGGQHTFDLFHSLRFDTVVRGIEAFAAWVRAREATTPARPATTTTRATRSGAAPRGTPAE